MKTLQEVIAEIKPILESKRYFVKCESLGDQVPKSEIERANTHGEAQLKNISDSDIQEAFDCCNIPESEEEEMSYQTLLHLSQKGFETQYNNLLFVVMTW